MTIKEIIVNLYPYNTQFEPVYNVPIVTGASTYTYINTGRSFIFVINYSLYYSKRIGRYMVNPNQF